MDILISLIEEVYLRAIGWTLVHSIWQVMVISLVLWLVLSWSSTSSSQFRYLAGLFALAVIIISTGITFQLSMEDQKSSQVISQKEILIGNIEIQPPTPAPNPIPPQIPSQTHFGLHFMEPFLPLLTNLWLLGALFFLAKLSGSLLAMRSLHQKHQTPVPEKLLNRIERFSVGLGIYRKIKVLKSHLIHVPITYGVFKPIILIPCGLLLQTPPNQLEAIIAHELAHIKRYDYLVNIFQNCMEVFFFFHPCFWWINEMVRKERENSCDDVVLALGIPPTDLAHGLAAIAEQSNANAPNIAIAANGSHPTLNRIKRIFGSPIPKEKLSPLITFTIIFSLMLSATLLMGAIPFPNEEDEKKSLILTKIKRTNDLKSTDLSLPLTEINQSNTIDSIPKPEEPKAPAPASPPQLELSPLPQLDFDISFDSDWFALPDSFNIPFPELGFYLETDSLEFEIEKIIELNGDSSKKAKAQKEILKAQKELMKAKEAEFEAAIAPKIKEYEAKIKAWEKENEPKIKAYEEKMKAWQEKHFSKDEEESNN